jgi:hypothetical protein
MYNCCRLPVPTLVTYNKTSYELENEILEEADIGPEVTHIYQVFANHIFKTKNNLSILG